MNDLGNARGLNMDELDAVSGGRLSWNILPGYPIASLLASARNWAADWINAQAPAGGWG
jgi:hypothetical protein